MAPTTAANPRWAMYMDKDIFGHCSKPEVFSWASLLRRWNHVSPNKVNVSYLRVVRGVPKYDEWSPNFVLLENVTRKECSGNTSEQSTVGGVAILAIPPSSAAPRLGFLTLTP